MPDPNLVEEQQWYYITQGLCLSQEYKFESEFTYNDLLIQQATVSLCEVPWLISYLLNSDLLLYKARKLGLLAIIEITFNNLLIYFATHYTTRRP